MKFKEKFLRRVFEISKIISLFWECRWILKSIREYFESGYIERIFLRSIFDIKRWLSKHSRLKKKSEVLVDEDDF